MNTETQTHKLDSKAGTQKNMGKGEGDKETDRGDTGISEHGDIVFHRKTLRTKH